MNRRTLLALGLGAASVRAITLPAPEPSIGSGPPPSHLAQGGRSTAPLQPQRGTGAARAAAVSCEMRLPMRVRFYDVGQALAVHVELPDGRHLLVDAGENPRRAGCGAVCADAHRHLLESLERHLGGDPIALLWITHQHSDHVGGAEGVLRNFRVEVYADNGQSLGNAPVRRARQMARAAGVRVAVIDPAHRSMPFRTTGRALRIEPVVPKKTWPTSCDDDANSCSIGLRVEYCSSVVLFTGDAEEDEEAVLEAKGGVTLLQVGHHGSDTSSSPAFIDGLAPRYAVISSGDKGKGLNRTYCHPRAVTVENLTEKLGGSGAGTILAFDGLASCRRAGETHWTRVASSDRLWSTSRDGDVTLVTYGDGEFVKE